MHMHKPITPTFITEVLHLVACVQPFKRSVKAKQLIQQWLTLIRLVSMTCFNYKATPIIHNDYSYLKEAVALFNQSYGVHIMPHHAISY